MLSKRIRKLNNSEKYSGEYVIYVISRDQRVEYNHALLAAAKFSEKHNKKLIVWFNAYDKLTVRNLQQFNFMYLGLYEVQKKLSGLNIPLVVKHGHLNENINYINTNFSPAALFLDFSPLRFAQNERKALARSSEYPIFEVDTHNIVPVWEASDKQEYAAYTIRPKISKLLNSWLVEAEELKIQKEFEIKNNDSRIFIFSKKNKNDWKILWNQILKQIKAEKQENYNIDFKSGHDAVLDNLKRFLDDKFENYSELRNDPSLNSLSNLSPYLHFGQISSLEVVLELEKRSDLNKESKKSFIEELVVRKELSDNFCFYNENYDNFDGLADWAKKTLNEHRDDKREYIYSRKELEEASTHDEAWNAAQIQMSSTGKMHGYMRMYWAKKILEWTESPEDTIEIAIYLNDKYSIDGLDPNGYVGIMWSIGGVHDRAWTEREVFGKIRYMNYNGLKRKFDIEKYITNWIDKK